MIMIISTSAGINIVITHQISGRASRVGGEPGITKAVLTKIQVGK